MTSRILVSVVVPTYRRIALLERCLDALIEQDLAPELYEILVADDEPSEATRRAVARRNDVARCDITYCPVTETQGPAGARNAGARFARGEILAFTDDDCVPSSVWLSEVVAKIDGADAGWGSIEMPIPDSPTDYEKNESNLAYAEFVTANCFCKKKVFWSVGGFDPAFTAAWREDMDLFFRLLKCQARIVHVPSALVVHPVRPAGWGVSVRQQRKSMFNALLYKKHPDLYRRHVPTPWRYYLIVGSAALAVAALFSGHPAVCGAAGAVWIAATLRLCAGRLAETSRSPSHVAEMAVTSAVIPFLSVYWRLYGAVKFRVAFM